MTSTATRQPVSDDLAPARGIILGVTASVTLFWAPVGVLVARSLGWI